MILMLMGLISCKSHTGKIDVSKFEIELYNPVYATRFQIKGMEDGQSVLIMPKNNDGIKGRPLLIDRDNVSEGITQDDNITILKRNPQRIVCMSSTYVAMLDAIGASDRIVGVSGLDYISCPSVHNRDVFDLGPMENVDYENLIALEPDLVLLYGIDGQSPMQSKLDELGIPYFYIDEYNEMNPLGKAEWLIVMGEIVGLRQDAERIFQNVVNDFNAVETLAKKALNNNPGLYKPKVIINIPYNGVWFMPSHQSNLVQLIECAGGVYTFPNNSATSTPTDLEDAYFGAAQADVWINVDGIANLNQLTNILPKFADVPPVISQRVWASDKRQTKAGGNDFYESAVIRPDLVLKDLYHIFYPDLSPDYTPYYYRQLTR